MNIGPGFTSKLFEMLQIVLAGPVLKSGSEWPHRKFTLSAMNVKTAAKPQTPHTYIKPLNEGRVFDWSNTFLIRTAPNICWATPDGSLPPLGFPYITVSCIFMFLCAAVWAVTINKSSFSLLREVLLRVFVQPLTLFRWWYWEFGSCARWRPKGLPYIIHYALAHQAGCKAALLWSHSNKALVISLPLGGQLLEQRRQKLQSTPACSDCSEGEREKEREGGWRDEGPISWHGGTLIL